jgi:hypothetical protein
MLDGGWNCLPCEPGGGGTVRILDLAEDSTGSVALTR